MKKVTFYIGLNDKDSHKQEIETIAAYKVVNNLICDYFGGGTILNAAGIWRSAGSVDFEAENTFKIEVLNFSDSDKDFDTKVMEFCTVAKKVLNQEAIAVTEEIINSKLV